EPAAILTDAQVVSDTMPGHPGGAALAVPDPDGHAVRGEEQLPTTAVKVQREVDELYRQVQGSAWSVAPKVAQHGPARGPAGVGRCRAGPRRNRRDVAQRHTRPRREGGRTARPSRRRRGRKGPRRPARRCRRRPDPGRRGRSAAATAYPAPGHRWAVPAAGP